MSGEPIKVTVTDPTTGEVLAERVIENDYVVLCAGNRYVDGVQQYPKAGTTVLTVKTERADRSEAPGER